MIKIGQTKTVGQPKTGVMRVGNATSTGFGIIYADEIIGHRRVDTYADLAKIPNWALYDKDGGADISTAKGQLWYVSGDSKLYQLTGIDASGANRTWTEFKGTDSSYSLPVMTDTVLGGAKLKYNTTQTVDANTVFTTAGRTYAVQKNSNNQLVVNVPWHDNNDNTTYTFEDGTNGSFFVTPSNGEQQRIDTGTPANAGHASTADSATNATNALNATNATNAASADKATKDGAGNVIKDTYATKSEISALTSALVYKGPVNKSSDLPTTNVKVGDVYVVATEGMYAGQLCENGDMIIAKVGDNTPEWTIVQTNIDGAITIKPNEKLTKDCIVIGASNERNTSVIGLAPSAGYLYWDGNKYVWKTPAEFNLKPASPTALGGIKIGFTQTGKNYPVKLTEDGNAYVYVPWTDTNTTYTADEGIDITNNVISWTSQAASNLSDALHDGFDGYLINIKQTLDASGIKTLTYRTGGDNGTDTDIIKIYDTTTGAGEGLASIKAVADAAKSLQKSITDETDALKTVVSAKVNTADKITEDDINALFTNN